MGNPNLQIRVKRLSQQAPLPRKANPGDLGYDLFSVESVTLPPGATTPVHTGIAVELPESWGALVKDRSSMALKGITTRAGVIDGGYRGEIIVVLHNEGDQPYSIQTGDKIAQLVPLPVTEWDVIEVEELSETKRGDGGFGSSEST
jgi:dUTP pyrophosphatase